MVSIIAYVYGKRESAAELKKALVELGRKTKQEKGNLQFLMHEREDDPTTFIFYETYQSEEAFKAHLESGHSRAFGDAYNDKKLGRADIEIIRLSPVEL